MKEVYRDLITVSAKLASARAELRAVEVRLNDLTELNDVGQDVCDNLDRGIMGLEKVIEGVKDETSMVYELAYFKTDRAQFKLWIDGWGGEWSNMPYIREDCLRGQCAESLHCQADAIARKLASAAKQEVRWNWAGSTQGYYVREGEV